MLLECHLPANFSSKTGIQTPFQLGQVRGQRLCPKKNKAFMFLIVSNLERNKHRLMRWGE